MTDEMTPERLAEIKARADAATTGPWVRGLGGNSVHAGDNGETVCEIPDRRARTEDGRRPASMLSNAKFIAHARTDVPALIAEVERLREALHDAEQAAAVEASARREFKARATAAEAKLKEAAEHIRSVLDDAEDLLRMAKIDPPDYPGSYIAARAFLASLDKGGDHDR